MKVGQCSECREEKLVGPLHLDKGGRDVCIPCGTEWHAQQARKRKQHERFLQGFGLGPSHAGPHELTLELLEEAIRLTHPDRHPDRLEQATRVTAELLALKPFVLPKPQRNASEIVQPQPLRISVTPPPPPRTVAPSYPCETCWREAPMDYCTACRERWETEQREQREHDNAMQRERRARRRRLRTPGGCTMCGTAFKGKRKDARYCSAACRQRAHRSRPPEARNTVGLAKGQLRREGATRRDKLTQDRPTLAELGIGKRLAIRARKLGALSEEEFEAKLAEDIERIKRPRKRSKAAGR
jgi:hypothetical protein